MNIGILVYSYTGNTMNVAEKIKQKIESNGDTAAIERVTAINGDPNGGQPIELKDIPNIQKYDKLVVGAPINGLSLCKAIKKYLNNHATFKNKEVNCFVTEHFKHSFMGGRQGIKQMLRIITSRGGSVQNTAIVHWSSPDRDAQIKAAAAAMAQI